MFTFTQGASRWKDWGMGLLLRRIWEWIREKFGFQSFWGFVLVVFELVPDEQARFVAWKEWITKMAHASWFPAALHIFIFFVGVALIVFDVLKRSRKRTHHIRIASIEPAHLLFHADHGYYSLESADPPRTHIAHLVNVSNNPAPPGKVSKGTGKIRGRLKIHFGKVDYILSPAAWCGEFFSFVEIEPGETRQLILAVSPGLIENIRTWNLVVNRRGNSSEAVSISSAQDIPFLRTGIIVVELILCETGSLIAQLEVGWEWEQQGLISGPTYIKRLL